MLALAWIDPGKLVKVRDLPGDLHGKIAHIKARNSLHATLARKNCAAKLVFADPVRADYSHARDHSTLHHEWSSARFYAYGTKAIGAREKSGNRVIGQGKNRIIG